MPVTALDPKTALVVIDLQKGLVSPSADPRLEAMVTNAAALAAAFRARSLPVVLVNVAGAPAVRTERPRRIPALPDGWTDLLPRTEPTTAARPPRDQTHPGGLHSATGLAVAHLKSLGVTQTVLAGVSTSNGVEVTGRQAYELGLNTAFATRRHDRRPGPRSSTPGASRASSPRSWRGRNRDDSRHPLPPEKRRPDNELASTTSPISFGGAFLVQRRPPLPSPGVMGRPFQSPFAKPPGQGLSSSTVNVLWGCREPGDRLPVLTARIGQV